LQTTERTLEEHTIEEYLRNNSNAWDKTAKPCARLNIDYIMRIG